MSEAPRRHFRKEIIEKTLQQVGETLQEDIRIILIGGGAMSLKGSKEMTKDIDIAVVEEKGYFELQRALTSSGFTNQRTNNDKTSDYPVAFSSTTLIFTNPNGFHIDVFSNVVCKRFHIDDMVIQRAQPYGRYGRLQVFLLSDEDIFIAKSVTERDKDLEDMFTLYRKGIEAKVIIAELKRQTALYKNTIWSAFMTRKLDELEELFDVTIPWKKRVEELAILEMEAMLGKNSE